MNLWRRLKLEWPTLLEPSMAKTMSCFFGVHTVPETGLEIVL